MDVLETVLRISNALKYAPNLKNHSIGIEDIKLLDEDDLLMIGMEEEEIRKTFLENAAKLIIQYSEKRTTLKVDEEYASVVLFCISKQLANHANNFMCALAREKIIICDVEMKPAVKTMRNSINSLEKRLNDFEYEILQKKLQTSRSHQNKNIFIFLLPVVCVILTFSIVKSFKHQV